MPKLRCWNFSLFYANFIFVFFLILSAFFNKKISTYLWICAWGHVWAHMLFECVCVWSYSYFVCLQCFCALEKIEFLSIISKVLHKSIWLSSRVHQTLLRVAGVAKSWSGVFGNVWIKICLQPACITYTYVYIYSVKYECCPFVLFKNQI